MGYTLIFFSSNTATAKTERETTKEGKYTIYTKNAYKAVRQEEEEEEEKALN